MSDCDAETLATTLARYGLELSGRQADLLDRYCRLLWDWNAKLNLTRHTDYDKFVSRDLVDSREISCLLEPGQTVLDVGTGGGVPGIVLAILRPDLRVSLCESVAKKARAVEEIVRALELPLTVHHDRAEKVVESRRFDVLVARAVGPLWKICKWFQPHWDKFGCLLAVKGPRWIEERGEARHRGLLRPVELRKAATYRMPGTESESVILRLCVKPREKAAGD
ncbi:MAG: 16S rRNA (guanine(527)-N(7))-methyltransferase RsmG [Candidatus Anammoximicrobium sp.]|nr:16S rRNA (guanine(527)-N(7))-methyltransferase RsmG [Candidatus Anammoximicrobium sp.]